MGNWTNTTTSERELYCAGGIDSFHSAYREVHGYLSFIVCLFGSVANLLNIAVLTRREMVSPTNAILTGMAVADLLVMLEYIPFSYSYLHAHTREERHTYGWALFVLLHSNFTMIFHTISIWLTVTLAIWRYIAVAFPQRNREWCGMQKTLIAIAAGYLLCPALCTPLYLGFQIISENSYSNDTNVTLYYVQLSDMGKANNKLLLKVNFCVYSVVIKIIPCVALTVLSLGLIHTLVDTKKRRQALTSGSRKTTRNAEKERQTDRTTRMLLAVLLLFLITEFPQGILGLLSLALGQAFFEQCYTKLGDVLDILALINSAINFMIYCSMSRQFRTTFSLLFRPRWLPLPQVENGHISLASTMVTQV